MYVPRPRCFDVAVESFPIVKVSTTFPFESITLYLAPIKVALPCGVVESFSLSTFLIFILPPTTFNFTIVKIGSLAPNNPIFCDLLSIPTKIVVAFDLYDFLVNEIVISPTALGVTDKVLPFITLVALSLL